MIDNFDPMPLRYSAIRVQAITRRDHTSKIVEEVTVTADNPPTPQAARILDTILPEALELFLLKNADRKDEVSLGDKERFVSIWKKVQVLHRLWWRDQPADGENVTETLIDIIGLCLLALDERDRSGDE